jgi:hypothetical protein
MRNRVEALQRIGAEIKIDFVDEEQHAVVSVRPTGKNGHIEAVFFVGPVGERLIETTVLGLRDPI